MKRRYLLALCSILGIACSSSSHSRNGGMSEAGASSTSAGSSADSTAGTGASALAGAPAGNGGAAGTKAFAGAASGGTMSTTVAGTAGATSAAGAMTGGTNGAGGSGGSGGSGGAMATLGCADWQVETGSSTTGTFTIFGGELQLNRPAGTKTYTDGPTIKQSGLSGDFDLTVSWKDFAPGDSKLGSGPTFSAGVFWTTKDGKVYSATASVGGATGKASIIHGAQFTNESLPSSATFFEGSSGSFRFERTAAVVTVTTTIDGQAVSAQSTEPFSEEPLEVRLWMSDSSSSGAKDAGVTITDFALSGGGGLVKPDDFLCP